MRPREILSHVNKMVKGFGRRTILIFSLTAMLLFGCNTTGDYSGHMGITSVAMSERPPIESAVWSPTAMNKVLVTATDLNHHDTQLYILDTGTLDRKVLARLEGGYLSGYAWSPDGRSILFMTTSGVVGEVGKLLIMNIDSATEEVLAEGAGSASWSPDGNTVAFFSYGPKTADNSREIMLHLESIATKRDEIVFTARSGSDLGLSWSPDGGELVFSLGDLSLSNLYVLDVATRQAIQITKKGRNSYPVWSPQGTIIAYQKFSDDGLKSSLWLVRPDGECGIEVPGLDYVWSPTWLPDGKKLGFVGLDGIYYADLRTIFGENIGQNSCFNAASH